MIKRFFCAILCVFFIVSVQSQTVDLTRYVNPFIGTADGLPENNTKLINNIL